MEEFLQIKMILPLILQKNILTKASLQFKNTTQLIVLTKKYKKMKLLLMERQN